VPFHTVVLGVDVTVAGIDLTDDEQITAVCTRGRSTQRIPILDLPLPTPQPDGATGELKSKVDRVWDASWPGSPSPPPTAGAGGRHARRHPMADGDTDGDLRTARTIRLQRSDREVITPQHAACRRFRDTTTVAPWQLTTTLRPSYYADSRPPLPVRNSLTCAG
jgi:hypothetical protein